MSTNTRYEEIAERTRVRRMRDTAFALLLAAVAAFSLTTIGTAAAHTRTVSAPSAPSLSVQYAGGGTCDLAIEC